MPPANSIHGDTLAIDQPLERESSLLKEAFNKTFDHGLRKALDAPRLVRHATGQPYEALNVDNFDEVPNSTWFTNRNGTTAMSLAEIQRGPNLTYGPDTTSVWTVVSAKMAGVTPGFTIEDARGQRYIVKFDPPDFSELPSGAEVVSARLMYAAGYNTPENYIAYLDPKRLRIGSEAMVTVETYDKRPAKEQRPMDRSDLAAILATGNPKGLPLIRVAASKFLDGIPIGPWPYAGVRKDDPNDVYPHPHRRELRGLYVVAAWLNHADMKEENTLDVYETEGKYVRHYLIDFGASLGSNSRSPSVPRRGQANGYDFKQSMVRLVTLGLYSYPWERASQEVLFPSVGYLNNDLFNPQSWKPIYPALAFENITKRDAFWGAKIVTSFSDAQIEAAVAAGAYSNPDAAESLVAFLKERRDMTGRHWFSKVNTLDQFRLENGIELSAKDLAVARGYSDASRTSYDLSVQAPGGEMLRRWSSADPSVRLDGEWEAHGRVIVSMRPRRQDSSGQPVLIYLSRTKQAWHVDGIRRTD
jgi:hypothetical protein